MHALLIALLVSRQKAFVCTMLAKVGEKIEFLCKRSSAGDPAPVLPRTRSFSCSLEVQEKALGFRATVRGWHIACRDAGGNLSY